MDVPYRVCIHGWLRSILGLNDWGIHLEPVDDESTLYEVVRKIIDKWVLGVYWETHGVLKKIERCGDYLKIEAEEKTYMLKSSFGWDRKIDRNVPVLYVGEVKRNVL